MKKILSLSSKHFLKGIGTPYDTSIGLFEKAEGIDFMRYLGLLAAGFIATDLDSGGTVVDTKIRWFVVAPGSTTYVYCYGWSGTAGDLYRYDTNDAHAPGNSASFPRAIANSEAQGMILYKGKILYAQDTQIGTVTNPNNADPTFDDSGAGGAATLSDSSYHPMEIGIDNNCYIGNINTLVKWDGSTITAAALTLPNDYTIIGIVNDGRYLVIGATKYPTGTLGANEIKIFYWDYLSSTTWVKEYVIPMPDLFGLRKKDDWIYAFTTWGIYKFNFFYSPTLVITEGTDITNLYCEARQGAIDEFKGHLLWGSNNGWAYGPSHPGFTSFLSNPLRVSVGGNANSEIFGLKVIGLNKIYVGAGSSITNKIYAFKTSNSAATAITAPIDLGRRWEIVGLKIVMHTAGSITGSITNAAGTAIVSDTITTSGLITARGTADNRVDQLIINLTVNSAARIKRIEVFANPLPDYDA